jgi:23S rRNA (cytidine1920-2'-O)/16S rRNA (cytidine1409-2'-O)-methyltransferase
MRIDQLLVQRGLASTRSQAQRLIADGVEWRQSDAWRRVAKNGDEVAVDAELRLLDDSEARYVSRGGLKLEAALKKIGLSVTGLACLDVGQSTGGFTDCLLQQGAKSVVGVDVGSAQLHPSLRSDPRVLCVEGINARALSPDDLIDAYENSTGEDGQFEDDGDGESDADDEGADKDESHEASESVAPRESDFEPSFDLIVADLSFISQTLVLPAIVLMLKPEGILLTLVKPQFELQPGQVGKGGIVKDPAMYVIVEQRLRDACADLGLTVTAWFDSPIEGGDGNHEFFICATHAG